MGGFGLVVLGHGLLSLTAFSAYLPVFRQYANALIFSVFVGLAWNTLRLVHRPEVVQIGLVLALEPAGRRMLDHVGVWTATVLMNGMIMTVFLWHLTAFVLVMAADWLLLPYINTAGGF